MRTIIAGSREFNDYELMNNIITESGFVISCVISGCASGADTLGEVFARENKILLERYPANWDAHGKSAGPIRNSQMAEVAEAAIVVCKKDSRGSHDMIRKAMAKNIPLYVQYVDFDSKLQKWRKI